MAPEPDKKKVKKERKTPKKRCPRNRPLGKSGVMRYSRSVMYWKAGLGPRIKKSKAEKAKRKTKREPVPKYKVKQVNGEKNGGTRKILIKKRPRFYPAEKLIKRLPNRKNCFHQHKRNLRSSLKPGQVVILLCGAHKGKRVVFLKQLKSGLLLVTGPFGINGCPLRRINQIYVIATKTRIDMSNFRVPGTLNDSYFKRVVLNKQKNKEGEIFATKKEKYQVSEKRMEDQKKVDRYIMAAIRAHPDKKMLFGYLSSMFSLSNKQYPHQMIF